jgi:predicted transcriptional regulator
VDARNSAVTERDDPLGPLARKVMEHLWRFGSASVSEVRDAVSASGGRELAYTTVLTILLRLHEKGYVTRSREGRHFCYAAAFDEPALRAEVGRRELRRLIERHGADSVAGFARDLADANGALVERLNDLAARRNREA